MIRRLMMFAIGSITLTTGAVALAQQSHAAAGAVTVLNIIEQGGNMHVRNFSNCGVPCFNVGTADGRFLETAMQRAKAASSPADLRVSITLQTEMLPALKGNNTIGTVPGRRADEIVIVNAHADGWFDAAGDNGDGLVSCVQRLRTSSGRGIPGAGVAPPSNTPGILGRRALAAGRRAPEAVY